MSQRRSREHLTEQGAGSTPRELPPPRVVICQVEPALDGGRHPIKRVRGERVEVRARAFTEGHDRLRGVLLQRRAGEEAWTEHPLESLPNDVWTGHFPVGDLGREEYALEVWIDGFASWRAFLEKKHAAGQDVETELVEGALLVREAAARAAASDAGADEGRWLEQCARRLDDPGADRDEVVRLALGEALADAMSRQAERRSATRYAPGLFVEIERERARSGAWYEFFPRSCASEGKHGSFRDCEERLAHAARMGFDVVYLPPIHPIGRSHRKGKDNASRAGPGDVGSPWAIGGPEGGHTAVHPDLGTIDDFDRLVARARELSLEVALDLAFQCSPDHPWVTEHPEWFRQRPDGSIHYAENPPKKYQDIYPLNFESPDWRGLWNALRGVVEFWIDHGVSIFRVDNPHTKPFAFWEWLIREVRRDHPDTVWLSEAFTRPAVVRHLAKIGFSQSYTYFTWRNRRAELEEFANELWSPPVAEFLRPNLFANTPDILHEYLQTGGRPAFLVRLVLAATLADSYGIYGPPFELCVGDAVPGSEEYRGSEKYQLRSWDLEQPGNIVGAVTRMNRIRGEQPALRRGGPPRFLPVDNENLIAFARAAPDDDRQVVVVVNLDPHHRQAGRVDVPTAELGMQAGSSIQVEDLLGGGRYLWTGGPNYVELDPGVMPAHVFLVRRRVRQESDFDYFL